MSRPPSELRVAEPVSDGRTVTVALALDGAEHRIRFVSDAGLAPVTADLTLPLALPPAMVTAGALRLEAPVSPRLLAAAAPIQEILSTWCELFRPVEVRARTYEPTRAASQPPGRGVAAFFSAGVDSFHTVLREVDRITHLVFLRGFDIPHADPGVVDAASATARTVAAALGKPLIEVETDVHDFCDPIVEWKRYFVAVLAAVGHLLTDRLERVLIPSEHSYADPVPWGGNPLLDPLWSSEALEVEHDGAAWRRVEKVADIASSELAMEHLRVCWMNSDGDYNCGRCEKCLRTMISLRAAGALERCATLPHEIDPAAVAALDLEDQNDIGFARENRRALQRRGADPELVDALREAEGRALARELRT